MGEISPTRVKAKGAKEVKLVYKNATVCLGIDPCANGIADKQANPDRIQGEQIAVR